MNEKVTRVVACLIRPTRSHNVLIPSRFAPAPELDSSPIASQLASLSVSRHLKACYIALLRQHNSDEGADKPSEGS